MEYRIKEAIRKKGISVSALAREIGMQRESLSRIINGASTSVETLERIALALGVNIIDLFPPDPDKGNGIICPNCGAKLEIKLK